MTTNTNSDSGSLSASLAPRRALGLDSLRRAAQSTTVQVFVLALLSAAVYWLALVRPYSLQQWWTVPLQAIGKMSHFAPPAGISYTLAISALFILYWKACQLAHDTTVPFGRHLWLVVLGGALVFNALLMFQYPVDAADIFDYIIRGRMQVFHNGNPFYQVPNAFPDDPLLKYVAWTGVFTAYGPGWELLSAQLARLAGDDVLTNIFVYKSVSVLAYAGTALVIALLLKRSAPQRALYGVTLFAWNPLVVYSTAGSGHHDALMVFFVVLGFYFLWRKNFTLAALAVTAGALVKYIPAFVLPVILLAALIQLKDWRARLGYLLTTAGACMLLATAVIAPYWRGGDFIDFSRKSTLFTTSLPTLLMVKLEEYLPERLAQVMAGRVALILLGAWILRELLVLWRRRAQTPFPFERYVQAGASILLFYLLVSDLWFQPWYVIWPLALAAVLPDGIVSRGAHVLAFASMMKMPIFDFVLVRGGPLPPVSWREWPLTIGTLFAPWFYFLFHLVKRIVRRGSSATWNLSQPKLRADPAPTE